MKNTGFVFLVCFLLPFGKAGMGLFAQYCVPVVAGPQPAAPSVEGITNVTLNAINNNSTSKAGYQDFTALKTIIYKGLNHTLFITPGDPGQDIGAAIDYNRNDTFATAGFGAGGNGAEYFLFSAYFPTPVSAGVPYPAGFTVPITAKSGTTRLRVASKKAGSTFAMLFGICNCNPLSIKTGDIEDYTVEIRDTIVVTTSGDKFFHGFVERGEKNKVVLGIEITPTDPLASNTLQFLALSTIGSSAPVLDITKAKLWYTNTQKCLADTNAAVLFGSFANPNGNFTITGNQSLTAGAVNYFWLTYDISNAAATDDSVKGACFSATINGINYTSLVPSASLVRKIRTKTNYIHPEANVWYVTKGYGLNFNCSPPEILTDPSSAYAPSEGTATISDKDGNLLFYTDGGGEVFNRCHIPMPTAGLPKTQSAWQGQLIVPKPGSTSRYYIFQSNALNSPPDRKNYKLFYSEVDMNLDNGAGDIILTDTLLTNVFAETQNAVKASCNSENIWLITGKDSTNLFYAYLITPAGIQPPVISAAGPVFMGIPNFDYRQMLKFSPNGKFLIRNQLYSDVPVLYDFNNSTGVVSNARQLQPCLGPASFSPDNSKLYLAEWSGGRVYQYDLCLMPLTRVLIGATPGGFRWQMQNAPDGKIYLMMNGITNYLAVINKPNATGAGCNLVYNGLSLPSAATITAKFDFPSSWIESYFNKPTADTSGFSGSNIICLGSTASFSVTPSGCSPGTKTWSWNFGDPASGAANTSASQTPSHLYNSAGTYTVTLVVNDGCESDTITKNITVSVGPGINLAAQTNVSCNGDSTGRATVNVTVGTSPYTYLWNSGQTAQMATGMPSGTYTVTVTDASGCGSKTQTVTITQPAAILLTAGSTTTACTASAGTATVNPSGGTPGYMYSWNPAAAGQTTQTATGLAAGTYIVTVTDANGCTQTQTVAVTSNNTLSVTVSSTQAGCTVSNGTATANPGNGTAPYSYNWNNGQITQLATGLGAITYSVTVTDASGCSQTATVTIASSGAPAVSISNQTTVSCNGGNNGSASVTSGGGISPYTYSWSASGGTASTATGLIAGTYTAVVTDSNGCSSTQTVAITQPVAITAAVTSTQSSCVSDNGTATVAAAGGIGSYTYLWTPSSATTAIATGLATGNYMVTVTDANGCTQTQTISVTQTPGPIVTVNTTTTTVSSGGNATLTAAGGSAYSWSPSAGLNCTTCADPIATPPIGGQGGYTYCVVVTDTNGCKDSACVTINVELPCGILYIPNAFSPNNDLENDKECVMGGCIETMHITIYDRWGEMVFESTDQKLCWDGMYDGKLLDTAVFTYYLEATLTSGEQIIKKGNISLIQ